MARVTVDTRALQRFAKDLENLAKKELDSFFNSAARALAAEFIQRVQAKTPVGDYPDTISFTTRDGKAVSFKNPLAGKQGGTLRDGWRIESITKTSGGYEVLIINPVEYAAYVEYGHRIKIGNSEVKGFQPGVFMMTATEEEIRELAPELIAKRFEKFLREAMNHK